MQVKQLVMLVQYNFRGELSLRVLRRRTVRSNILVRLPQFGHF